MADTRAQWGSRIGFILAAAGSAVGLGNMWKFPYITGENGGGAFVLVYLASILLVGLPIMIGEILLGRTSQRSTVGAFRKLAPGTAWAGVGWLGVAAGIVILSYYSVVAGWAMHYVYLSLTGSIAGQSADTLNQTFGGLVTDSSLNLMWHTAFMAITIAIVIGGVQKGVERAARLLMPLLLLMMGAMLIYASTLDGFGKALDFVFGFHTEALTGAGVLEAVGHSFFTLSVGMGAMLTYGSYLKRDDDLVGSAIYISVLDTLVALMACLVLFPITFTQGMEPAAGPGLVFKNMPIAFASLLGGGLWSVVFFSLLTFAALTSSISLLEVAASYFIDERGWSRKRAVLTIAGVIFALGIPSALSNSTEIFGSDFAALTAPAFEVVGVEAGKNWFDTFDYLASNWMLPLGGLGIAAFAAWRVGGEARQQSFAAGSSLGKVKAFYLAWLTLLRYVVPIAIILVMLHALGALG